MRALTRRLTLEARTGARDAAGGLIETWVALGHLWAAIDPVSAEENYNGGRPAGVVSHRAVIRWSEPGDPSRPLPDQRLREGARIFAIRGVTEADERRETLVVWLEEGTLS